MIVDCEERLFQSPEYKPIKDEAYQYLQKFGVKCFAVATALTGMLGCNFFPYGGQTVILDKPVHDVAAGSRVTLQVDNVPGAADISNSNAFLVNGFHISLTDAMWNTTPYK